MNITPPPAARKATATIMSLLLATGTLTLSPAASADQPAGTGTQGEQLVNGDFEYPGATMLGLKDVVNANWTAVERQHGMKLNVDRLPTTWVSLPGFDKTKFGWDSTETDGPDEPGSAGGQRRANEVELQYDVDGNTYAELAAAQSKTSIYQDVATTPGVAYTVSLKHASLNNKYLDRMRVVMTSKDGSKTIVPMTRITANGNGDKVGETSDVIATTVTNTSARDHAKQWETYTGTYIATTDQTTFAFESVDSRNGFTGNILDDISFKTAYPLTYDGNGATTGTLPQQTN